jgi:hypothetical protein
MMMTRKKMEELDAFGVEEEMVVVEDFVPLVMVRVEVPVDLVVLVMPT